MFSSINGSLLSIGEQSVVIEAGGLGYEIIVPPSLLEPLRRNPPAQLRLVIYASLTLEGNSGRFTYFGFHNPIERDFFEAMIGVASIGPRSAARAFSKPMSVIAQAIDAGDATMLTTLPGIGKQKAREIIAKLQGKVTRFLLIAGAESSPLPPPSFAEEALTVLQQLGYKLADAQSLIQEVLADEPQIHDAEALLAQIYRRRSPILAR
jgi:Holliday junction DNA helicase RuvA